MSDITDIQICPHSLGSRWMKLIRFSFKRIEKNVDWDLVKIGDSINVITFNTSRKKLIFVRQFRPSVYSAYLPNDVKDKVDIEKYPPSLGLTIELCAGLVDKNKSLTEIARDELLEECGYQAPLASFQRIVTARKNGPLISSQTLFYVEVTDEMKTGPGGGLAEEGEVTEVVEMSVDEVEEYLNYEVIQSPTSFLSGIYWFLLNKKDRYL